MPSCWCCGGNSGPDERTAGASDPELRLSLSGPEVVFSAAGGWAPPPSHSGVRSGLSGGDRPYPGRGELSSSGMAGALSRARAVGPPGGVRRRRAGLLHRADGSGDHPAGPRPRLHRARRNKALENSRLIGLALDGTGAGRTRKEACRFCDPIKDSKGQGYGCRHHFVLISVVGAGLILPVDVEPYGAGDSEYAATQRLLLRAAEHLGPRFADYAVGDGEYATAPFLHAADAAGLPMVARLKENLPLLAAAPCALASTVNRRGPCFRKTGIASRSGMRRTSIPGKPSTGPPCACCATASTNPAAP